MRRSAAVLTGTGLLALATGLVSACGLNATKTAAASTQNSAMPSTVAESFSPAPAAPGGSAGPAGPAASTPGTATAPPMPAGGPGECRSAELKIAGGTGDAGMSNRYLALVFTNVGSRSCTVRAFPGVSAVAGDDGHQVGQPAHREGDPGAGITLRPGQAASSTLHWVEVGVYDPADCAPAQTRGLRIYPPDETNSRYLAGTGPDQVCTKGEGATTLGISTLVAGVNGSR
jgi:hypothetical protein